MFLKNRQKLNRYNSVFITKIWICLKKWEILFKPIKKTNILREIIPEV